MLASLALISRVAPAPRARCFASAAAARSSGKGGPGMDQGPTETGTPGSASVDDIASSKGAYDGDTPRPQQSGQQIEHEKPAADMSKTAADSKSSEQAPAQNQPESQGQKPGDGLPGR